tara:strand:- start:1243 stop:1905 length:663 start_codon:yes stop_codon:yes gene_type:complete
MHLTIQNLTTIYEQIQSKITELNFKNYQPKIVAISKTFKMDHIEHLINYGHQDFGENKVQEAVDKWIDVKDKNNKINLHMVGKLQTNKVKFALKVFDYIHSLDNVKLARKISEEQKKHEKKPKLFVQINIGNENQKSGIKIDDLKDFYTTCKNFDLDIIGTMCIPPDDNKSENYFSNIKKLTESINLSETSMGMSNDFLDAIKYKSTYLRIGSKIFGERN